MGGLPFAGHHFCLSFRGISKEPSFVSFYKVELLKSWQVRWLAKASLSFYFSCGSPLTLGFFSGPGLRQANLTFCSTMRSQIVFSLTSFSFPSQQCSLLFWTSSCLGLEIKFQVSTHLGHSVSFTPLPYPTHGSKGILNMCRAFIGEQCLFIRGLFISDYAILYAILVDLKCFIFSRLQLSHLRLFLQVCLCKVEVMNMYHPLSPAKQGSSVG